MGQKFVTPSKNAEITLDELQCMSILDVRTKASEMNKMFRGQPLYFIGRKELQKVFSFDDRRIYECIKTFSIHKTVIRIGSVDFWGALALAASGNSDEKIGFCFKLMDTNRDDYLSMNELVILLICITRGLARLKGFEVIPEEIIDNIVLSAFQNERKKLSANGEIALNSFVGFCLSNDLTRGYLGAIGAKVPPVNAQALVLKRTHALKQIADTQYRIDETIQQIEELQSKNSVFNHRDGDLPFLKLFEESLRISQEESVSKAQHTHTTSTIQTHSSAAFKPNPKAIQNLALHRDNSVASFALPDDDTRSNLTEQTNMDNDTIIHDDFMLQTEQDMLLALPKDHPVKKYILEEDNWKNEVYRIKKVFKDQHKPHRGTSNTEASANANTSAGYTSYEFYQYIYSRYFEADLYKQWKKLPHDEDDLALVDELTLVAIFQQCNVCLTYAFARDILLTITPSQCKKYHYREVLQYFRYHFLVYEQNDRRQAYHWYRLMSRQYDFYQSLRRGYKLGKIMVLLQRKILTGLVRVDEVNVAKMLAEFRNRLASSPSTVQFKQIINADRIKGLRKRPQASSMSTDKPITPAVEEDSASGTFPVKLQFNMTTVPFTNISTKRPRDSSRLRMVTNPDGSTEPAIFDMISLQATDVLDFFNLRNEKQFYEEEERRRKLEAELAEQVDTQGDNVPLESVLGKKVSKNDVLVYQSVTWCVIEVSTLELSQVVLLRRALEQAFLSIPPHTRSELYSHCHVEICSLGDTAVTGKKAKRKSVFQSMLEQAIASAMEQKSSKVILVALLHTDDHFIREEKDLLQSDMFISRGLLRANVELKVANTWEELYDMALQYVNYESKLYGPQENELGELVNPLQFAKDTRQRKKDIDQLLPTMPEKSKEELQNVCRQLGVRDLCQNKKELIERLKTALSFKKELIGHWELSNFGQQMIAKMFMCCKNILSIDASNDSSACHSSDQSLEAMIQNSSSKYNGNGLSLWEFNKYLATMGTKTFYDKKAYKTFVEEQQILVNRDDQVLLPGMFNLYEKVGHLAEDNQYWRTGSLDEMFAGVLSSQFNYEPEALKSLLGLLPDNPRLFLPKIFKFFQRLVYLKEYNTEMELDNLSQLIELIPWGIFSLEHIEEKLLQACRQPGYLAHYVNEFVSYVNDMDIGPLHHLRIYVASLLTPPESNHPLPAHNSTDSKNISGKNDSYSAKPENKRCNLYQFDAEFGEKHVKEAEEKLLSGYEEKPIYMPIAQDAPNPDEDQGLGGEKKDEEPEEEERIELPRNLENIKMWGDRAYNLSIYEQAAQNTLPSMISKSNVDYYSMKNSILDDITFLQTVRGVESLSLSLEESEEVEKKKVYLEEKLEEVLQIIDEQDKQLPAHLLAAYDALRMFGKSVVNVGLGSKDITIRLNIEGIDLLSKLPAGMGEKNDIERLFDEKSERFVQRRQTAMAAIERERLRRAMTDEDYERIRLEKLRKERLFYEAQDKQVYDEGIKKLYESREERKMMGELGQIVKLFEEFHKRKENRGTGGIDILIAKNNMACVMVEVYGVEHPLSESAQFILQEAAELVGEAKDDFQEDVKTSVEGKPANNLEDGSVLSMVSNGTDKQESRKEMKDDVSSPGGTNVLRQESGMTGVSTEVIEHAAIKALIILNYLDILIKTQSFTALRSSMPFKEYLLKCLASLNEKEKEKLGKSVVPEYRGLVVLHTSVKHESLLQAILQELAYATSNPQLLYLLPSTSSLAEEMSHALSLHSKEKGQDDDDKSLSSAQTKTSAQLRKEKKQKYDEQRSKDNKLRAEVTMQRKLLYDLIQTNKISEIFAAKATVSAEVLKPNWGEETDSIRDLQKAKNAFEEMANTMATHSLDMETSAKSTDNPSSPVNSVSSKSKRSTFPDS